MGSGFPTHHADGLPVRVAVQFELLMVSLTFSVHFHGFCGCRGPTRLQIVEVAQFIHQVLYQVVLGETHFREHLQKKDNVACTTQKSIGAVLTKGSCGGLYVMIQ